MKDDEQLARDAGLRAQAAKKPLPVMQKPKGKQFLCVDCKHVSEDGKHCDAEGFINASVPEIGKPKGSNALPFAADDMCSNWFEPKQ